MAENVMRELFGDSLFQSPDKDKDGKPIARTKKEVCATDFKAFCEYYLKDYFPRPWSKFHLWLIDRVQNIILRHGDDETRDVVAAPRGHAKSTVISFALVIWCTCYHYRSFIVILSATTPIAKQFIIDIRQALTDNSKIKRDFGEMPDPQMWNTSELLTQNKVYITSRGAGSQLRGMKFNGTRPDLIVIDDLESVEDVSSPTQIKQMADWFNADVMPMGAPNCSFFMIGTVLSYESLLYHMLNDAKYSSWSRKTFKAVIKFSDNPLWHTWEEIMTDLKRGDHAYADATKFYKQHKEEMLKGTEVLWPDQRADMYKHLMERRLESEEGFNSEFQNDPQTESTRLFKEEWLKNDLYVDPPKITAVNIAIDPALASKRNNDYSAIIAIGRGVDNYFYVLEASIERRPAEKLIDDVKDIVAKYYAYKPKMVCETNQFQQFFSSTLQRDFVSQGIYLEWVEVYHNVNINKAMRIESLIPHIKQGYIKFKDSQRVLLSQLKNYPKAHDDGPDCLEMALKPMLQTSNSQFSFGAAGGSSSNTNFMRKGGMTDDGMEWFKKKIMAKVFGG